MTPAEKIREARERDAEGRVRWAEQEREMQERRAKQQAAYERDVQPHLRDATPREYARWLVGFLERGGEITHYYDYKMPWTFYIAIRDFSLPPFYGSLSVSVIVPAHITVEYGDTGHNNLFLMDGFHHGGGWVPVYSDFVDPDRPSLIITAIGSRKRYRVTVTEVED